VPEPRTHYQVSFTARQGVFFFVFLLAALAGAYFLGVATGVSGRPNRASDVAAVATSPPAEPTPEATPRPPRQAQAPAKAVLTPPAEARTAPPAIAAREPATSPAIQFFEDETTPGVTPGAATETKKAAAAPGPASSGFWIQVLSSTSETEAKNRRMALASKGYRAAVSPAHGARGPTLYRVRVGPYASKEEAAKASGVIERKEKVHTWIVPPGE
jgi:cell division protein FtsN